VSARAAAHPDFTLASIAADLRRTQGSTRLSLAIRAVTVGDEGGWIFEPVRHGTAGTVTVVLLTHFFLRFSEKGIDTREAGDMAMARTASSFGKRQPDRLYDDWIYCESGRVILHFQFTDLRFG
jgi:hypothetical protein